MLQKIGVAVLAAVAVLLIIPIAMRSAVVQYSYTSVYAAPQAQVALILGASVYRHAPSPVLAARADAAVALYRQGKVSKILVTGDNGALSHDEVTPVRKYLLARGVAPQDIFLDHAGFDTYSSMARARGVFQARSVIVTTQDFHMPRALWIARRLGLVAYGLVAPGDENSTLEYIREIPASLKALWDVATGRSPKFLGPVIPITGDGRTTWY